MALNIKNPEVERLADELAQLTGETKTETVRRALAARKEQLAHQVAQRSKGERFLRYLEEEVWPRVPQDKLGRRLSKREREEILGYDLADRPLLCVGGDFPQTDLTLA